METPEKRDLSAMDLNTPSPTIKIKGKRARKQILISDEAAPKLTELNHEDSQGQTLPWRTETQLYSLRDSIVGCIKKCLKSEIIADIKTVCAEIKSIQARLQQTEEKIIAPLSSLDKQNNIKESDTEISLLKSRLAVLEHRNRRSNLRIVALTEGTEGGDPIDFLQKSIPLLLPSMTRPIEIERAHSIYDGSSTRRDRPRTFIFKLLHYTDWQLILRAARNLYTPPRQDGSSLLFHPDYSAFTALRRKSFAPVQKSLRQLGVQNFLLYPAKLKIIHDGQSSLFDSAQAAERFLSGLQKSNTQPME
ncbi:UNVERIFIED_CONTAM: hypothetical protein FKN15_050243 [Acipenser sinensis]